MFSLDADYILSDLDLGQNVELGMAGLYDYRVHCHVSSYSLVVSHWRTP